MAPFVTRGKFMALSSEDSILLTDLTTGVTKHALIPVLSPQEEPNKIEKTLDEPSKIEKTSEEPKQKNNNEDFSHINMGTCLSFSPCTEFLAACTSDKNLTVWKTSTLEIFKQWKTARKVSSLTFNSDGKQLIVADKAGDCFVYSNEESNTSSGKLIMGHLSMLLDVAVTADDKFIVTSERDEKIRVSHFPNAYNIHTFCLGHTEFVTSIALLSPFLLLSGSGDGTLRLWDYTQGKQLHVEKVPSTSDGEMETAVRFLTVLNIGTLFLAAVLLNKGKSVMLYKISTNEEYTFECQTLPLSCCPLAAALKPDGELLVLTDDSAQPIKFFHKDETHQYTESESDLVKDLHGNHHKFMQDCVRSCNGDLKPLYKRWFDNVQAYRERKEERMKPVTPSSPKRVRVN